MRYGLICLMMISLKVGSILLNPIDKHRSFVFRKHMCIILTLFALHFYEILRINFVSKNLSYKFSVFFYYFLLTFFFLLLLRLFTNLMSRLNSPNIFFNKDRLQNKQELRATINKTK